MNKQPAFPNLKPLELADRAVIHPRLWDYQPEVSELTFANLYIWRGYYDFRWAIYDEKWLVILGEREGDTFMLPPIGSAPRADLTETLLQWMQDERGVEQPEIRRADQRLVDELGESDAFEIQATRDQFDYVYKSEDLGELEGRKYSAKRNQISQFERYYQYRYEALSGPLLPECLELAEVWCEKRMCEDDISLSHEFSGIEDTLNHFDQLEISGGALVVDGKVQAFSLGEKMNEDMGVVHIEKANPDYKGIYPMMTQSYSAERWMGSVTFINREQDLGIRGLRRAKESYYPDHMVRKYNIRLA